MIRRQIQLTASKEGRRRRWGLWMVSTGMVVGGLAWGSLARAQDNDALSRRIDQLEEKLEAAVDALAADAGSVDGGRSEAVHGGHGASSSATFVGGYGELHYNNWQNNAGGADKKEIDFHRFILFLGHEFSDRIRFFSETELEHSIAGDGQVGAVELEQAFVDLALNDRHTVRAGLFLIPAGIINEIHEPPTFYGVERNPVEKNIIPSTWWEGGVGLYGELAPGVGYDLAVTSGLNTATYKIRSGRQKVGEAKADDLAYTARLRWRGLPGVELAGTLQWQENITQGVDRDAAALLFAAHTVIERGVWTVKALYATWQVDGAGAKAAGMDEQTGWYIEPSMKINPYCGVFFRYNLWDNQAGDNIDSEYVQMNAGVNYWPHENVAIKVDVQQQDTPAGSDEFRGVNLGVGYHF